MRGRRCGSGFSRALLQGVVRSRYQPGFLSFKPVQRIAPGRGAGNKKPAVACGFFVFALVNDQTCIAFATSAA